MNRNHCFRAALIAVSAALMAAICQPAAGATWCVNPKGTNGCFSTIGAAVSAAQPNDTIAVASGTYKEYVTIGEPLSLIGAGAGASFIDATGLAHGIFVDGLDHPGLHNVTIAGFTVENALFEGVLVLSSSDVTIRDNSIVDNDKSSGLAFTGKPTGCPKQQLARA